jgi:hypothetical protein
MIKTNHQRQILLEMTRGYNTEIFSTSRKELAKQKVKTLLTERVPLKLDTV